MRMGFVRAGLAPWTLMLAECGYSHYLRIDGAPADVDLTQAGGDKSVVLKIGPDNVPNTHRIVDAESYIVGPGERRYGVLSRPFAWDRVPEHHHINKRDEILLLDADGSPRERTLEDGIGRWIPSAITSASCLASAMSFSAPQRRKIGDRVSSSLAMRIGVVSALFVSFVGGCASKPTISTTLTDLIAESNDYDIDPVVDFHENLSINGLLLQPQAGAHWYTARPGMFDRWRGAQRSSPAFAIGISARLAQPSFCLSGETPSVPIDTVNSVKESIEAIQALTLQAVAVTVDLAVARASSREVATDKLLTDALRSARSTEVSDRIKSLTDAKTKADEALAAELQKYRSTIAKNPGLIVARWTVRNASGGSAKTGIFDVSADHSDTTSGYLVLGGLRVSTMYFGDDFRSYINTIEKTDRNLFDRLGITTYLIQTRALAYTNSLDLQESFAAALSVKVSSLTSGAALLTEMDKVTITGYVATARNLDNTGSLSGAKWYAVSRPMVEYVALTSVPPELPDAPAGKMWVRVMPSETFAMEEPAYPLGAPRESARPVPTASAGDGDLRHRYLADHGWYTVDAVSATAPRLYREFRKATKGEGPEFRQVGERSFALIDVDSGRAISQPR